MRLFIAINFNEETKQKLLEAQNLLRESSLRGNFSRKENLHITVVFIGEVDNAEKIKQLMSNTNLQRFKINFSSMGKFYRDNGELWWIGINHNETLQELYNQLSTKLKENGFKIDGKKFNPHLTLARGVKLKGNIDNSKFCDNLSITTNVESFDLMKSERINGVLTYTKIYSKKLT